MPQQLAADQAGGGDAALQARELHTELAAGYYERGQMDVALEELDEAMKLDPNNAEDLQRLRARLHRCSATTPKAERNFQRALELAPTDSEIRHNWGWYLCTHGRPRESIAEFEVALRNPLYKTPEIALTNAGKCSVEARRQRGAATSTSRRALALKPGNPAAAYNLALLVYRDGAPRRVARADALRDGAEPAAARGALPRHVHRAQARRPAGRAVVPSCSCATAIRKPPRRGRSPPERAE